MLNFSNLLQARIKLVLTAIKAPGKNKATTWKMKSFGNWNFPKQCNKNNRVFAVFYQLLSKPLKVIFICLTSREYFLLKYFTS